MIFDEFIDMVKTNGLESIGLFYSSYRGEVVSNEDPENLGRIQLKCSALYADQVYEDWVIPKGVVSGLNTGIFWLPNPGDPVYVSCEGGDPRYPLWEYGWWLRDKTIPGAQPGVHVFLTPQGQRIELNDETKSIEIKNQAGFNVKINQDGIFIGKDTKNLGKLLDDLFQLFSATTVATIYGPSPFNNVAAYNLLREDIAQFLKTS